MVHSTSSKESSSVLDVLLDNLIGVLDVLSLVSTDNLSELTILIDGNGSLTGLNKVVSNASLVIILTKARGAVHNTGTSIFGNKLGSQNSEAAGLSLFLEEGEHGLVLSSNEVLTLEVLKNLSVRNFGLLGDIGQSLLHANVDLLSGGVHKLDVVVVGVHCEGQVGGKGPWGGGPCNQVSSFLVVQDRESHDDSRVIHILVVGTGLEVRQHSVASSRERHNFSATIDKSLIVDLLESPPNTFHEVGVHSLVIVVEVNPSSESVDNSAPFRGESHDNLTAELVVLLDTEGFTLGRVSNLVNLVNLELNGQTVAIPTKATGNVVALHGSVASDDILTEKNTQGSAFIFCHFDTTILTSVNISRKPFLFYLP